MLETQYHIPVGNIEEYNKHTLGWTGCNGIIPGMKMCPTKGDPRANYSRLRPVRPAEA